MILSLEKDVDIVVLTCNKNITRQQNIRNNINLPFTFFESLTCTVSSENYNCGAVGIITILERQLLKEPFRPLLFLEDDANKTKWYKNTVEIIENSDAVYLGLSNHGVHDTILNNGGQGITYDEVGHPEQVRLKNMLSLHACLMLSKRWMLYLMRACVATICRHSVWDLFLASNMLRYNVYAAKYPYFYQDSRVGGVESATYLTIYQIPNKPYNISDNHEAKKHEPPLHLLQKAWKHT
jgi:hypothetical protein